MSAGPRAFLTPTQTARMERILLATLTLISEVGAEGTTMRAVANASGTSIATLYNRFNTKDNLITVAILDNFERNVRSVVLANSVGKSPIERLIYSLHVVVKATLDWPVFTRALIGSYFKVGDDLRTAGHLYPALASTIRPMIEEMMIANSLVPWAVIDLVVEEISDRIFSVHMRWARRDISDQQFAGYLLFSVLTVILSISRGKQARETEKVIARLCARIRKGGLRAVAK